MSDSTPNIDQYKGNYYISPDEVLELRRRISELERAIVDALHYSSFTNAGDNMAEILTKVLKEQEDE